MALHFEDVCYLSANGTGNPIHMIETLCIELQRLNKRIDSLDDELINTGNHLERHIEKHG